MATHTDLVAFTRGMIDFRKRHPALRRGTFFTGQPSQRGLLDIAFHGCNLNHPGFNDPNSGVLAFTIADPQDGEDIHAILNMEETSLTFQIPTVVGRQWFRSVDTSIPAPHSLMQPGTEVQITADSYFASRRSVAILVSKPSS